MPSFTKSAPHIEIRRMLIGRELFNETAYEFRIEKPVIAARSNLEKIASSLRLLQRRN